MLEARYPASASKTALLLFLVPLFGFACQEIARVAKKFRRLAERHGLESMTAASNRLRAHLHALVSRGVQEGLFFRNRAVHGSNAAGAAAVPTDFYRNPASRHQPEARIPYPRYQPEPWNSREGAAWRGSGRAGDGGGGGTPNWRGGGGSSNRAYPPLPFSGLNMDNTRPGQKLARPPGWRWGQGGGGGGGDGDDGGGGSDAGSRASDDGRQAASNHSGSVDGSPEGARGELEGGKQGGKERQGSGSGNSSRGGARSKGYGRRSGSGRRKAASRTEPWILDLSNSGREDEQQRRSGGGGGGSGVEFGSPHRPSGGYAGARRGRAGGGGGGGEEGGWFRWHGGDNRMFRPVQREEGGGRFSDGRHPSTVSEDGSWEGTVDWWPRPRSPPPAGAADSYYAPADFDSGLPGGRFMNPFPGPQGSSSLLPAVPTFEESGTRVSWADYRGHRLAEVRSCLLCRDTRVFCFGAKGRNRRKLFLVRVGHAFCQVRFFSASVLKDWSPRRGCAAIGCLPPCHRGPALMHARSRSDGQGEVLSGYRRFVRDPKHVSLSVEVHGREPSLFRPSTSSRTPGPRDRARLQSRGLRPPRPRRLYHGGSWHNARKNSSRCFYHGENSTSTVSHFFEGQTALSTWRYAGKASAGMRPALGKYEKTMHSEKESTPTPRSCRRKTVLGLTSFPSRATPAVLSTRRAAPSGAKPRRQIDCDRCRRLAEGTCPRRRSSCSAQRTTRGLRRPRSSRTS